MDCFSRVSRYLLFVTIWLQLLVCWFRPLCVAQTCSSTGRDRNSSCSQENNSCRTDHREQNLGLCGNFQVHGSDDSISTEVFCPSDNYCPGAVSGSVDTLSSKIELMPIELHAVDIRFFAIHVSWNHPSKINVGYEIRFLKGQQQLYLKGPEQLYCICINGSGQNSVHIRGSYAQYSSLFYFQSAGTVLTVEIIPIHGEGEKVKTTRTVEWPTSCLDARHNSRTCGSPVFQPPSNVVAFEVCDTSNNFTLDLRWDHDAGSYPSPSLYYINVISEQKIALFRFVASGTTSVRIQLPNASLDYTVIVQPYGYCSGIANYTNSPFSGFGCGRPSESISLQNCPPTLPATASTVIAVTLATTKTNYFIVDGCSTGAVLFIIVLGVVSSSCIIWRKVKKKSAPVLRRLTPSPNNFSVFVVHAPQADVIDDIQTYIVCPLQESFDVVTSGDMMRGDVIEWIEVQVREKNTVLLVFTKEFFYEWEGCSNTSPVVRATQRLLMSAVAQDILDKYAIVVLDEEVKEKYIPDNHYLKSLSVYVMGRKMNEIDDLCRFVTKTTVFEHEGRASCSPISSTSLSGVGLDSNQSLSFSPGGLPSTKHAEEEVCSSRTDVTLTVSRTAPSEELGDGSRLAGSQPELNLSQKLVRVLDQPSCHLAGETPSDLV